MEDSQKKATKSKKEPKVEIFGEDIQDNFHRDNSDNVEGSNRRFHFHHHYKHGSLTWGLAFILVGLLLLLSNFGALPPIVWSQVAHLWPLLIILIGFDTLLGHSEVAEVINSLIALFVFATILGVVFLNYSPSLIHGLPQNVLNYLYTVNSFIQPR